MELLRKDINNVKNDWNVHIISKSRNNGPRGRPDVLYELPHLYGVNNCLIPTEPEEIDQFYPSVAEGSLNDVSTDFKEFAEHFMQQDGLSPP